MARLYATGITVAVVGFAIWKLFGTLPTDVVGIALFGIGILIAGSMELLGLVMFAIEGLSGLGSGGGSAQRDRKAQKAANERAAARARTAARQAAREAAGPAPPPPS